MMTGLIFMHLCDDWSLGYDAQQWIVYRAHFKGDTARYLPVSFICSTKSVLRRVMREKGLTPTPEAQAALNDLPESFRDFIASWDGQERRAA